jgi:deaminated glutathione amidase
MSARETQQQRRFRIAAVQMVSGPDVAANCAAADRLIAEAAVRGATLVVLPEYFPIVGMKDGDKVAVREKDGVGPIQDFLRAAAVKHAVWLVGGSVPLEASVPEKVRNSCLAYDDRGRRVARYDKVHLFGFARGSERYDESATIEPGAEVVTFDAPLGRVGLSICYDVRFPELYRAMGEVSLICLPAAFTQPTGEAHWELLVRTRAVENQCYVVAAAQGGVHASGRITYGDTMIVDPWGVVLDRLAKGPGFITAELDLDHLASIRSSLPALGHRRF